MRRYIIAGNWKMFAGPEEAKALAEEVASADITAELTDRGGDVVLCPPYVSLAMAVEATHYSPVCIGAQNCHHESQGAFTGEVSPGMLREVGATWVILGHSERRRDQHETDTLVGMKVLGALEADLKPIVCIGETLEERKSGRTAEVVTSQISGILEKAGKEAMAKCVLAYEPIWAIGTGEAATPKQAQEVHRVIKDRCAELGFNIPVLYGGSVKDSNADELFQMADIDGALVGGASLIAESFVGIVTVAVKRSKH